jgi:hypothetical protein
VVLKSAVAAILAVLVPHLQQLVRLVVAVAWLMPWLLLSRREKKRSPRVVSFDMFLLVKSNVLTQDQMTRATMMTGELNQAQNPREGRNDIVDIVNKGFSTCFFIKRALMGNDDDGNESFSCGRILVANQRSS